MLNRTKSRISNLTRISQVRLKAGLLPKGLSCFAHLSPLNSLGCAGELQHPRVILSCFSCRVCNRGCKQQPQGAQRVSKSAAQTLASGERKATPTLQEEFGYKGISKIIHGQLPASQCALSSIQPGLARFQEQPQLLGKSIPPSQKEELSPIVFNLTLLSV